MPLARCGAKRHAALSCTASSEGKSQRMAQTRIIKKYPNRRLYDTDISSYITLEDVRQLIVDNEPFEVRDAKTSEDITRSVLLQSIYDQEQDAKPSLSHDLLTPIIGFSGDSHHGFMARYIEQGKSTLPEHTQQLQQTVRSARRQDQRRHHPLGGAADHCRQGAGRPADPFYRIAQPDHPFLW